MSAIWKIGLFSKLSPIEAKCGACERTIQMTDRSTKGLFTHAKTHEEFAKKLKEVEENQASQKNSMDRFVKIVPQGQLSSLDKKVVHLIACENLPFAIVDAIAFKTILDVSDRESLKGRHHYSDWVMPRMYGMVKSRIKEFIDVCPALSFTSDIWSGPTESFISLTVHAITKEWKRLKFILCVQPFSGSHNFETIGEMVEKMLRKWEIPFEKTHVFVRDEGSNMKKAFKTEGYSHADCGAHKLNLIVNKAVFYDKEISAILKSCRTSNIAIWHVID